jgi:ketosteroid isomerase-like protein
MSQENVETVQRVIEAMKRRDIDAVVAEHDPAVEFSMLRSSIEGPYRGHNGIRQMAEELFELVPDMDVQIDEVLDCGDKVIVVGTQRGTVRGAMFDRVLATVSELHAGKITRVRAFATREEALEAAALKE